VAKIIERREASTWEGEMTQTLPGLSGVKSGSAL
jgi:hypothetical protein